MGKDHQSHTNPAQCTFVYEPTVQDEQEVAAISGREAAAVEEHAVGPTGAMRDDTWLMERVRLLWENHFKDVPRGYPIVTRFGTRAQYRFGSIAARSGKTIILINRLFAREVVPAYVVDATLAHELAHYAHGFGSGLPKLYQDAHRGGVVDKELERRGLGEISSRADRWREEHWPSFYEAHCTDLVARRAARGDDAEARWREFFEHQNRRTEAELRLRFGRIAGELNVRSPVTIAVEWLPATRRQTAPSYWFARAYKLRLHGLLADRRAPDTAIDFELAYWITRLSVGAKWQTIHQTLLQAGKGSLAAEALLWRRRRWNAFVTRNHPLRCKEK